MSISPLNLMPYNSTWTWLTSLKIQLEFCSVYNWLKEVQKVKITILQRQYNGEKLKVLGLRLRFLQICKTCMYQSEPSSVAV